MLNSNKVEDENKLKYEKAPSEARTEQEIKSEK